MYDAASKAKATYVNSLNNRKDDLDRAISAIKEELTELQDERAEIAALLAAVDVREQAHQEQYFPDPY